MVEFEKLRQRITLQKPSDVTLNSISEMTPLYETVAEIWAKVDPLSSREFLESQKFQNEIIYRIIIRKRDDVAPNWQILYKGKRLQIMEALPSNGECITVIRAFEKVSD